MKKAVILATLVLFVATLFAPVASFAGSKGRRNTAVALTAVSVYSLVKGKTTQGLVGAAGSAYAWKRYNDARQAETRKKTYRSAYKRGYNDGKRYAKKYQPSRYARR